jgi:Arc/MetJ family transcription regulator
MRTNVVIDDELLASAMQVSGLKTKRAVIEAALKTFLQLKAQEEVRSLWGAVTWEGDLDAMRLDRDIDREADSVDAHGAGSDFASFVALGLGVVEV